jgi:hypothetical protein
MLEIPDIAAKHLSIFFLGMKCPLKMVIEPINSIDVRGDIERSVCCLVVPKVIIFNRIEIFNFSINQNFWR